MRHLVAALLALVVALAATACGGIADPSDNRDEDFFGEIGPFEGDVFEFDVSEKQGEYSAKIIAQQPTQSALFNIHLGTVVNGLCQPYIGHTSVTVINRVALSGPINKGHYCIQVYDQGSLTVAHTYTLRVSHP